MSPKSIKAAIRWPDGTVTVGVTHALALIAGEPACPEVLSCEDREGFVVDGEYVSRAEAHRRMSGPQETEAALYSEDL